VNAGDRERFVVCCLPVFPVRIFGKGEISGFPHEWQGPIQTALKNDPTTLAVHGRLRASEGYSKQKEELRFLRFSGLLPVQI
jgi:hypothetical protein